MPWFMFCLTLSLSTRTFPTRPPPSLLFPEPSLPPSLPPSPHIPCFALLVCLSLLGVGGPPAYLSLSHLSSLCASPCSFPSLALALGQSPLSHCRPHPFYGVVPPPTAAAAAATCWWRCCDCSLREGHRTVTLGPREGGREGGREGKGETRKSPCADRGASGQPSGV